MISLARNDRVKLINARIADVENGRYLEQTSLVIENGKIAALPELPGVPDTDAVIDLQGKALIPGMFNTHCHLQFGDLGEPRDATLARNLADCLDRGVTTVRDTLCYDLTANRDLSDRIARGELPGPRIVQAIHVGPYGDTYAPRQGPMVRFLFPLMKMPVIPYDDRRSGVVAFPPAGGDREVRDALNRAVDERGAAAIKFCDQPEHFLSYKPGAAVITARQLAVAVDQAQRRGVPTTIHNVTARGFREAVQAGVRSLAHLPIDAEITDDDVALLLRAGSYVEPTLTVAYYMAYPMKGSPIRDHAEIRRLAAYRDSTIDAYLGETWPAELRKNHRGRHDLLTTGEMKLYRVVDLSTPFRYMAPFVVTGAANLRRMVRGGALAHLACGNDAGPADCSPAVIGQELAMFDFVLNCEDRGTFTAADALRVATIQSARSLGLDATLGSIETGKIADLAVVDGDPLRDATVLGKPVAALFKDGQLVVDRLGLKLEQPAYA